MITAFLVLACVVGTPSVHAQDWPEYGSLFNVTSPVSVSISDGNIKDIDPGNLTKLNGSPSQAESQVPADFRICGIYPNPFNPSTTIELSLEKAGFAELVMYNVMGQKVRELAREHMIPGIHQIVWDGRDDTGGTLSAGVYIVQLKMGEALSTGRMTLIK